MASKMNAQPEAADHGPLTRWLLASRDPWVRLEARRALLGEDADVERRRLVEHPLVRKLASDALAWPDASTGDHRSAKDLLNKLSVLADLGLRAEDLGLCGLADRVFARCDPDGVPLAPVVMPGKKEAAWVFDVDGQDPLLAVVALGAVTDPRVERAVETLVRRATPRGGWTWPQARSPLPCRRFAGGCPFPTLKMLRILARLPARRDARVARESTSLVLDLFERRGGERRYGFGFGDRFAKLRYPFVWFDVLHALEALSPFPWVWGDARFRDMLALATAKADTEGRYTPESVFLEWKDYCFGQKREPSPWLTLVMRRILAREPARERRRS